MLHALAAANPIDVPVEQRVISLIVALVIGGGGLFVVLRYWFPIQAIIMRDARRGLEDCHDENAALRAEVAALRAEVAALRAATA